MVESASTVTKRQPGYPSQSGRVNGYAVLRPAAALLGDTHGPLRPDGSLGTPGNGPAEVLMSPVWPYHAFTAMYGRLPSHVLEDGVP